MMPALVAIYSKPGCHLCHEALEVLAGLQEELGFELREIDISGEQALHDAYFERIPVITLDGEELCEFILDEQILRDRLESRR